MSKRMFAAICVGSYEVGMKLFEFPSNGLPKVIEHIHTNIEIGRDSYFTGTVAMKNVDEICRVLRDFLKVLDSYGINDFIAVGTSGFRATSNTDILLDQIRNRTGINIQVLNNSEQRFLEYKALFIKKGAIDWLASKNTLIAEIGGSSVQISFFSANPEEKTFCLNNSHNLKLGLVRLRELAYRYADNHAAVFESLLQKMTEEALAAYQRTYDRYKTSDTLIVLDGYLSFVTRKSSDTINMSVDDFVHRLGLISENEICQRFGVSQSRAVMLKIAATVVSNLAMKFKATRVYFPGTDILDGMAVDFGLKSGRMSIEHNFDDDIFGEVSELCARFRCDMQRNQKIAGISEKIFNALKRVHGLTVRDKLLLRIAALLYDCGCYIGIADAGENAYRVIGSAEIVGITRSERMDVAKAVKYCFEYAEDEDFEYAPYPMKAAKLSAILKLGAALARSDNSFVKLKITLQEDVLYFHVTAQDDMTLERGIFEEEKIYLNRIFGVKSEMKVKLADDSPIP